MNWGRSIVVVLTVKVNYMNALIPTSKVVNHDSILCGYDTNMQESQNMAVYAVLLRSQRMNE